MKDEMFKFYKNALSNNLCDEYKNLWRSANDNKSKLVQLSLIQQSIPFFASYCYNGDGLSKDFLLQEYAEYINGTIMFDCDGVHGYSYQLFVDYKGDVLDLSVDISHFMFCDGLTIQVQETKCPTIYLSNKSNVNLVCLGYNNVRVMMFDESKLTIDDCDEESCVTIFKYNDKCNVSKTKFCLSNNIKEHNKELRL
jgi:hypothetical protein